MVNHTQTQQQEWMYFTIFHPWLHEKIRVWGIYFRMYNMLRVLMLSRIPVCVAHFDYKESIILIMAR